MRTLAMGHSTLMDGFALLGIETYPNASVFDLEQLLKQLRRDRERALIYLQQDLAQADLDILDQVRNEGGHILISELPDLLSAEDYQAPVDALIQRVLGASAVQGLNDED